MYEDFSNGPKEARRLNIAMKSDITKLTKEIDLYKHKWLKDADIFSKITNVLQDELSKRDVPLNGPDIDMEGNENSDEDDEDEARNNADEDRLKRQRFDEDENKHEHSAEYSDEEHDQVSEAVNVSESEDQDIIMDNEEDGEEGDKIENESDVYGTKDASMEHELPNELTQSDDIDAQTQESSTVTGEQVETENLSEPYVDT